MFISTYLTISVPREWEGERKVGMDRKREHLLVNSLLCFLALV